MGEASKDASAACMRLVQPPCNPHFSSFEVEWSSYVVLAAA